MLKKRFYILLFFCLLLGGNVNSSTVDKGDNNAPFENKRTETDYLPIADPFVMLYNNKYYAYGTGGTVNEGFACFSSDDLKNWKRERQALSADDSYGKWGFWAPEVYYIQSKKKFYMFYSVEEHICVATSDSPVGPFRQESKQPIWEEKSIDTSQNGNDIMQGIDKRHQGLAGRFTYGWKYRYFFDFNFGYNGSENFAPGHQYGFFPAYSAAWNIAEEPIIKKHLKWMNMFKLRYSYGKVGNDVVGDNDQRFPYLSTFGASGGFNYADIGQKYEFTGLSYTHYATTAVTWEIATKHDIGIDFSLWDDKFTGTIDYFHEQRDGIYQQRNFIPISVGLNGAMRISTNIGSVLSKGFDGNFGFKQRIGDVNLTLRGNFTYSKSEILEYDEEYSNYPYKSQRGFRVDQTRGLIALGLFKDYDDIRNSPKQSWGDVMPGDIKYADVNGDGYVNDNDIVPIGATTRPNLVYGFGLSGQWKGIDINVLFQGSGKSTFCIDGPTVYPFENGDWGNILTDVVKSNRWILGENEDPNAKYPRLSYGGNSNNYRASTYWLRNGSYLRLKNLEIGYTIPKSLVNKMHLNNIRIYFMGTNLVTFSSFKLWDPELGSSNGQKYPLSKSYTLGLTINI